MENYTILLNSAFLIGIIIGILIISMIMNIKINRLDEKVDQIIENLESIKWNRSDGLYRNEENIKFLDNRVKSYPNTVNIMSYRNEADSLVAATSEAEIGKTKVKADSKIGIVFCRNCASQFTSDQEECPSCGARRH